MLGIGAMAMLFITLIVLPGINSNAEGLKEHISQPGHPVTMNEFKHIEADLKILKNDVQFTKEHVVEIYQMLCDSSDKC